MKTVVLVGRSAPFADKLDGAELWGVNTTYRIEPNLSRVYHLDSFDEWPERERPQVIAELDALDVPVVCQQPHPLIRKSEAFPIQQVIDFFGVIYYTSTLAYMIADAIRLGFERIVVHRLLRFPHSLEYIEQKSCMDFWCGVALGRGVTLTVSEDSSVTRPYPWQPALYGYVKQENGLIATQILAGAVKTILDIPSIYDWTEQEKDAA